MDLAEALRGTESPYQPRINRVIDHIARHLAEPLDLPQLAAVAHFSPWHFHRVFQGCTGETLADCVRRLRLEAAALALLRQPPQTALSIALEVGFASAEVFTRAFKARFGTTPGQWRQGGWRGWVEERQNQLSNLHQAHRKEHQDRRFQFLKNPDVWPQRAHLNTSGAPMNVELITLPALRLAYMRHTGPYGHPDIPRLWSRFADWCDAQGLMSPRPKFYGIGQDNPLITPASQCRYDVCVAVPPDYRLPAGVNVQDFPGGRYACTPFHGRPEDFPDAWQRMYTEWLPRSRWQPDDQASIEIYDEDFAVDPATGAFSCRLAVPVRPL